MHDDRRGILYPQRLPSFTRLTPAAELAHIVQWFWVPEWSLDEGVELRQEILPYPACNLVVEPGGVSFVGPPTRRSERVLSGSGWAVGALLRPAGAAAVAPAAVASASASGSATATGSPAATGTPLSALRDRTVTLDLPELHQAVRSEMDAPRALGEHRQRAVSALSHWLIAQVGSPTPSAEDRMANQLAELIADPEITRVDQLGSVLHTSTRTLQRLAERHFGLSLHSMIRRRRVQEAADQLRTHPTASLSALANDLGYADHAHFATDFKAVVGMSPSAYRQAAQRDAVQSDAGEQADNAP